jgi:hypothetical protein
MPEEALEDFRAAASPELLQAGWFRQATTVSSQLAGVLSSQLDFNPRQDRAVRTNDDEVGPTDRSILWWVDACLAIKL